MRYYGFQTLLSSIASQFERDKKQCRIPYRDVRFVLYFIYFILLSSVLVLFTATAIGSFYLPDYLKNKIETEVQAECEKCRLKIGDLDVPLFQPGDLTFHNLDFSFGDEGATQVFAKAALLDVHISLRSLLKHHIYLRNLMITHFDVTVIDGDKHSPPPEGGKEKPSEPSDFTFSIAPLRYLNGSFQYVRNHEGTTATLHVQDINGTLTAVDPKSDHIIKAHLTARYERSGHAELEILTNPFIKPLQVDVKLAVNDQDLNDLTLFFEPNAGVQIHGKINEGLGLVSVIGDELKATDWIVYQDLDAKVLKGKEYSGFVAFFENLGLGLAMQSSNVELEKDQQTKSVELKKEGGESLISFILRGLKEAAMKVATRSNQ